MPDSRTFSKATVAIAVPAAFAAGTLGWGFGMLVALTIAFFAGCCLVEDRA